MSDEHVPDQGDDQLDPAQEHAQDGVRRLLAEARHEGPVPPEVAARLDAALARLVDERQERAENKSRAVDELAARRRRKRWTTVLAAAAAVVAVGVAAPQLGTMSASEDSNAGAGTSADAPMSDSEREFAESGPADEDGAGDDAGGSADAPNEESAAALAALPSIGETTFREDVAGARKLATSPDTLMDARAAACGTVPSQAEQVVLVRYDAAAGSQAGYLVFEPAVEAGQQLVTLYVCPGGVPVRSAVVPGP
jgi:hypothetical protein